MPPQVLGTASTSTAVSRKGRARLWRRKSGETFARGRGAGVKKALGSYVRIFRRCRAAARNLGVERLRSPVRVAEEAKDSPRGAGAL